MLENHQATSYPRHLYFILLTIVLSNLFSIKIIIIIVIITLVPISIIYMKLYYEAKLRQSLTIKCPKCRIHINNRYWLHFI